jgi:hypothetical protein
MADDRALRRLEHIRGLEEEQRRTALEAATRSLAQLRRAQDAAAERDRRGRRLLSAWGDGGDRQTRRSDETAALERLTSRPDRRDGPDRTHLPHDPSLQQPSDATSNWIPENASDLDPHRAPHRFLGSSPEPAWEQVTDRLSGIEEVRAAGQTAAFLSPLADAAAQHVEQMRAAFLVSRVERRQAGALLAEARALAAVEAGRRAQQMLDDWFRNRRERDRQLPRPANAE